MSMHIYMQPYAHAIEHGAKCLLDDLDSRSIFIDCLIVHKVLLQVQYCDLEFDNCFCFWAQKEKSIKEMVDVKAAIKKLISPEVTYVPILQLP